MGGDAYYDYLGSNNYRITFVLYRDCNSGGAEFDQNLPLGVFLPNTGARIMDLEIPFPGSQNVTTNNSNPCGTPVANICTERAVYSLVVNLPPNTQGYMIAYQRCCRGPSIVNLNVPEDTGLTISVIIPPSSQNHYINSSPRFENYPPLALCNNFDLEFDHSAVDPDGDVLVYSLATPNSGATPLAPAPNPIPNPPYALVNWAGGYSATAPLGPGSSITIDPNSGLLTVDANLQGRYVIGIRVDEYRDGVLISTFVRDFIFQVSNCTASVFADLPLQTELSTFEGFCDGLTVNFENESSGTNSYFWDFGDLTTTTDVSTQTNPSYTYPGPGEYTVMVVAGPNLDCSDTAYMTVSVNNELIVGFDFQDSLCIIENQYEFLPNSSYPNTTFTWDFGPNGNQIGGTGDNPLVNFSNEGVQVVTLTGTMDQCVADSSRNVYVIGQPNVDFELPITYECDGLNVDFINNTTEATFYTWDFGDNTSSSVEQPDHAYPNPGQYTVNLVAGSSSECLDSMQITFTVYEPLMVSFTHSEDQCISENSFDFDGTVSGPPIANYTWDFGDGASIPTSNDIDVFGVTYSQTGAIPVTLTGTFNNCVETASSEIYIYTSPTIDFALKDGQQCAPFEAYFLDSSTAETEISYNWDFGDGGVSTEMNPVHIYENPGSYPVTLTISTAEGCTDTLSLLQADLVNVLPIPQADFSLSTEQTDICHAVVGFTNLSTDATSFYYNFDDANTYSNDENPFYGYINSGTHYPYLIASNEEGCSDTATARVIIEPFTVFIPNAFTPDEDEFNNTFEPQIWLTPTEWEMKIYNRWGEVIFETHDPEIGWDGTYRGRMMQDGVYLYTIKYKPCTIEFTEVEDHGFVHLIR